MNLLGKAIELEHKIYYEVIRDILDEQDYKGEIEPKHLKKLSRKQIEEEPYNTLLYYENTLVGKIVREYRDENIFIKFQPIKK